MVIEISSTIKTTSITSAWIRQTAAKIYSALASMKKLQRCYPSASDAELSILVVADKKMRSLNSAYRHKDKTTDVLSFPQIEPCGRMSNRSHDNHQLGDIVINLRQAERQARARGVSLKQEVSWLLAHGILHLAGYDHETSSRHDAEMRKLEQKILSGL
ncbi:MAG: rRNA maturation RNase YbeY [Nitrospiraceae bacterium]|nr:rRNA maturation RNase YbeY [Nitrospiraceae bacterium]